MGTAAANEATVLFQKLKPCCVKISQHAIRDPDGSAPSSELVGLTAQLCHILEEQVQSKPDVLDAKLAEYIFFPLVHIFRQKDRHPVGVIENCVKSLRLLITHGWGPKISAKLVQQIFSLLGVIIDGSPGSRKTRKVPEETVLEALRTQTALLGVAAASAAAASGLTEQDVVPVLGHGVTVMLDAAVDGTSPSVQLEGLRCLQGLFSAIREVEALASFLPGTVSSLTRILSQPKRHKLAVLAGSLEALQTVLTRVLGDLRTRPILAQTQTAKLNSEGDDNKVFSPAWLRATVSQVKVALVTVMKLRTTDAPQVRETLEKLCIVLLDECHSTLSDCSSFLVETAMMLGNGADESDLTRTGLSHLVIIYPELGETVKTTVWNWTMSLVRVMQFGDDESKKSALSSLSQGIDLLGELHLNSAILNDRISAALKDSVVTLLQASSQHAEPGVHLQLHDGTVTLGTLAASAQTFQPLLLPRESEKGLRRELMNMIGRLGNSPNNLKLASDLSDSVWDPSSISQTASLWLCFELIKATDALSSDVDALLDLSQCDAPPAADTEMVFSALYSFAVRTLEQGAEYALEDWRLPALSLEVVAYAAQKSGRAFRPELIDVLFPIATFLGADDHALQQHAMTALNSLTASTQYANVSDLIVDNVDYMVNSVALKLRTLAISPASHRVLWMMIRLAGPRVLPFLDDVVDSIFLALENYHGYTSFVEGLFVVLKEIVDQAARSDRQLLADHERKRIDHAKKAIVGPGLGGVDDYLAKRSEWEEAGDEVDADESEEPVKGHPKKPWKTETAAEEDGEGDGGGASGPVGGDEKPPSSPTYQLLLRIATLTQHHLTSPAPNIRRSLLELLTAASSVLAGDEDSFLPLIHAVWPVVIVRLYDAETFVTIEACKTLSSLCEAAGDFMSSRFRTEWDNGMRAWCEKARRLAKGTKFHQGKSRSEKSTNILNPIRQGKPEAAKSTDILIPIRTANGLVGKKPAFTPEDPTSGNLGQHSSPARVWEAVVKLLTAIVTYVRVDHDMFDQILDLLSDAMLCNEEVRLALETVNAEAVWLFRTERGLVEPLPTTQTEDVNLAPTESPTQPG